MRREVKRRPQTSQTAFRPKRFASFASACSNCGACRIFRDELFKRMGTVYARILPGYSTKARDVQGGVFFVIGPNSQMTAYEQYLKTVEGPEAKFPCLSARLSDYLRVSTRGTDLSESARSARAA